MGKTVMQLLGVLERHAIPCVSMALDRVFPSVTSEKLENAVDWSALAERLNSLAARMEENTAMASRLLGGKADFLHPAVEA